MVRVPKAGGSPPEVLTRDLVDPVAITLDTTSVFVAENDVGPGYGFQVIYKQDKQGGSASRKQLTANNRLLGSLVHGHCVIWAMEGGGGSVGLVDVEFLGHVLDHGTGRGARRHQGARGRRPLRLRRGRRPGSAEGEPLQQAPRSRSPRPGGRSPRWSSTARPRGSTRADASSIRFLDAASPGGAPTDLATNEDPRGDRGRRHQHLLDRLRRCGRIRTVPKAGGVVSTLASGEGEPLGIAVDATGLYWTNHADGRVRVLRR